MGTLVSRIKKSTRWIIGIVLWVLFVFSGNLAFPLNRIFGLVLAIAFGAYVLACSIWKYNPDSHDEDEPPKITFKWSYLLIVMLTMVLITSAVGRMDSTAEKQATVKAEKKQTAPKQGAVRQLISHRGIMYIGVFHGNPDFLPCNLLYPKHRSRQRQHTVPA